MALQQQLTIKEVQCGRLVQSNSVSTARPRSGRGLRRLDTVIGMQPSLQVWRRPAPQQGRCRCVLRRAFTASTPQAEVYENRPHMVNVSFKVEYKCAYGQCLTLVGNTSPLGNWSSKRGQRMHWSRGDIWTCNVMLPAGSDVECKYVIVDELGHEQRWQEGTNMVVKIPATCQGLPVQRYDVGVSWCKTFVNCRAQPATTSATAAAATIATADATAYDAHTPVAAAASAGSLSAAAAPVMAWALAKGASAPTGRLDAAAAAHTSADDQTTHRRAAPAANTFQVLPSAVAAVPAAAATIASSAAAGPPPRSSSAPALLLQPPEAGDARRSKTATLVQAAVSVVRESSAASTAQSVGSAAAEKSSSASASSSGLLTSFQLSPATGEGEPKMSIVLPSRSRSPPVKISLSSNFSRLMDMPALSRAASPALPATPTGSTATAPAGQATASALQSHPIEVDADVQPAPSHASASETVSVSAGQAAAAAAASGQVPASTSPRASAHGSSTGQNRKRPSGRAAAPVNPTVWGMEYDIYAYAYGLPYMHTPFDLEAYTVYDQEPSSSLSSVSSTSPGATHGSFGYLASNKARGTDPLESAVQAAHSSAATVPVPAPTAASSALLSAEVCYAAAASTAWSSTTATASNSAAVAAAPGSAPPTCTAEIAAPRPADAVVAATLDVYRQVSRSSTSIGDWAGRTLIEMSSSRSLTDDDDSDEDECADDEAAVAQAMAAPAAPADMAALLTQLGTALGRSVRLRYDGIDATAQDLLDLDRKIALAASKLYRQRDSLLTGWLRKETRRQLAAAAAPVNRLTMPTSNTVTPV